MENIVIPWIISSKINIPFNLASRIITITNTEELRDTPLRELKIVFENSTISGGNS
jgi:hypothetical protein